MIAGLLAATMFGSFQTHFVFAAPNEQSLTKLPGVVATSSSDWNKMYVNRTIDGNVSGDNNTWVTYHKASPHWLKIQLPEEKTISKYVLHHYGVFGDKRNNPWSFKVSVSTDDVNYTQVDQVDGNIYDVTQRKLGKPEKARYVRVDYITPEQNYGQLPGAMKARLAEIELFSSSDAVSTLYQQVPTIALSDKTVGYTGYPVIMDTVNRATATIAYTGGLTQIPFKYFFKRHGVNENYTETAPTQLGSYDAKAVFEGNDTYRRTESNMAVLTIAKANIALTLESRSFEYTSQSIAMTGAVSYPIKVPFFYKYKALTPGAAWKNAAPIEVGTYLVKAVFAGDDVALQAESNETTMSIVPASQQTNWAEISGVLSGLTAKQLAPVDSFYLKGKYMVSGMLMGNGTFGVVSDARKNEQSYYLASGDAFKNNGDQKLLNAQLKLTNGDPINPEPVTKPPFIFNSSTDDDKLEGHIQDDRWEPIYYANSPNAFDSDENTEWISRSQKVAQDVEQHENQIVEPTDTLPRSQEKFVSIQGKQPFTFDKIEIKHHSVRFPDEAKYNLYDFNIQTSNDGNSWSTIKSVKGNVHAISTFEFAAPITTSFLRVTSTTPVAPQYATLYFPKDMTSARITDINMYRNGVNVINPPKPYDGRFLHERDILNAEIRSKMEYNSNLVSYQTWTADDQNAMFTNVTLDSSAPGPQKINIQLAAPEVKEGIVVNTTGIDGNAIWLTRNAEIDFVFRGATATKVIKGNFVMGNNAIILTLTPGETAKVATVLYTHSGLKAKEGEGSIMITKDLKTVRNIALQKLNAITEASINTARTYHLDWWKNYWLKSYVNVSDPSIQDFYYTTLYILGSAIRQTPEWAEQPNVVGGLNGLFNTNDDSAALGRAVTNYNYEAPFYGLFSSNRTDMLQPYFSDAVNGLSFWQHETADRGYKGVQIGRHHIQVRSFFGVMAPHPISSERNPRLSSDQKTNVALFTMPFIWDWKYTRNVENLRRFVYPSIKEVVKFYCDFVVKESDGKYWVYFSNEHEAGNDTNPSLDMGYIRSTFRDYIEMAQFLNVDADLVAKCQEVLDNLMPIPTSKNHPTTIKELADLSFKFDKEIFVGAQKSYNKVQINAFDLPWASYISNANQPTMMEGSVHPSELLNLGSDPALLQIARNTFEYGNFMNPHSDGGSTNGFPKSFTIAARLGIDPDKLMERFRTTLKTYHNTKQFYDNGASYENTGALESVNSMLLQNELNAISGGTYEMRLFPAWSKNYNAKFVTLRAKNAFRVSSELKNGQVQWAEIISDAGRPVTLVSPWTTGIVVKDKNGNKVPATQGKTRHTNEVTYTFNTVINGVYTITKTTP
ncbi:discoidin domain-containing protein [Paenibacillus alba]|uniref:Discoidin domain-containing protein n=1 Tax=Paenibacillus alba TaxID=1197127 RepID=A0ABU6FXM0_9BACL|nr:discoidin domain-containing protein [Paenibacillus alba]MEC0226471.1 discoidin domain-containing protein [Paenibacillus alba]